MDSSPNAANSYIFLEYTYNKKCILTFFFNVLNYM